MKTAERTSAREKLLGAALAVIRAKGYSATTVDDLCARAGVSKGAFFHHFESKEALAIAAAQYFSDRADAIFAADRLANTDDPRERVLAYVDARAAMAAGEIPAFTCLLGTMVQETYESNPAIRDACDEAIRHHAEHVARDLAEAKALYAPNASWSPDDLALFTQTVVQGAFVLAKAQHDPAVARDAFVHLRRYLETQLPKRGHTK